jgi:hypothetical protein
MQALWHGHCRLLNTTGRLGLRRCVSIVHRCALMDEERVVFSHFQKSEGAELEIKIPSGFEY